MAIAFGPRGYAAGTATDPFASPMQAQVLGAVDGGLYYLRYGAVDMSKIWVNASCLSNGI